MQSFAQCLRATPAPPAWVPASSTRTASAPRAAPLRRRLALRAKRSLFDEVIDGLEGGRKLRRWYGSDSSVGTDGSARVDANDDDTRMLDGAEDAEDDDDDVELDLPKRSVLVTNADGELGEAIAMQLIVAKVPVVCVVENTAQGEGRFGPYATFASTKTSPGARLNGVRSVVVSEDVSEDFLRACARRGVKHVVLVSATKNSSAGLAAMFSGASKGDKVRRDRTREALARSCGVATTVVRASAIRASPGGARDIIFEQGDTMASDASITMEDLAEVCTRALTKPPPAGQTLAFETRNGGVRSSGAGACDWASLFAQLDIA